MSLADFRQAKQVFYGSTPIKQVWYMGERLWEQVETGPEAIFRTTVPITKMGNTIMLSFNYNAWRHGRPESINGKTIRFRTGGHVYDYTIRISDAQATTMSLMFTTTPTELQSGTTYTIEIMEAVATPIPEWRPMSRVEIINRTVQVIDRPDLTPSQGYTEQGRDGREEVTWEAEYLNGTPTGNTRNEKRRTLEAMVPDKHYLGIKNEMESGMIRQSLLTNVSSADYRTTSRSITYAARTYGGNYGTYRFEATIETSTAHTLFVANREYSINSNDSKMFELAPGINKIVAEWTFEAGKYYFSTMPGIVLTRIEGPVMTIKAGTAKYGKVE